MINKENILLKFLLFYDVPIFTENNTPKNLFQILFIVCSSFYKFIAYQTYKIIFFNIYIQTNQIDSDIKAFCLLKSVLRVSY
jgi:hypothetical protein